MNRVEGQRNYWDSLAPIYNRRYAYDTVRGQRKIRNKAKLVIDALQITDDMEILEIGCGTGAFTRELAETKAIITAVDISAGMLDLALSTAVPCNVYYMQEDIHTLGLPEGCFDAIVGFYILQYLDMKMALRNMLRLLRTGGKVAFVDINALNPVAFVKTRIPEAKRLLGISYEAESFTPRDMKCWFETFGFSNVSVKAFGLGWANLFVSAEAP